MLPSRFWKLLYLEIIFSFKKLSLEKAENLVWAIDFTSWLYFAIRFDKKSLLAIYISIETFGGISHFGRFLILL